MAKKRKRKVIELCDHSAHRNKATASVVDFHYRSGTLKVNTRVVKITSKADAPSIEPQHCPHPADEENTQEIREDDVGVLVRAKTRSKRYVNSVGILVLWKIHMSHNCMIGCSALYLAPVPRTISVRAPTTQGPRGHLC